MVMRECPLCGGRIKKGKCRICGFVPEESLFGDGRDELMGDKSERKKYTAEERKEKISKSMMTLQSALMYADSEQDIISILSSCIGVFDLPLKLDPNKDFSLDDKEKEILDIAEKLIDKVGAHDFEPDVLRPETLIKIGNAFFASGDMDKALELYDKTLKGYPRNEDAMYNKAYTLFSMERYDKSEHALDKFLEVHPGSTEVELLRELVKQLK